MFCVTSGCLACCIRARAEKRFCNALSDLILTIQFIRLVFGNKKKYFVLIRLRQSARAGQVVLHGVHSSYFPEDRKGQVLDMKIHYSINSVQGSIHQGSETFFRAFERNVMCIHGFACFVS